MSQSDALAALSALAHEHRLGVFRMLIRMSPEGLTAGDIAARMQQLETRMSQKRPDPLKYCSATCTLLC